MSIPISKNITLSILDGDFYSFSSTLPYLISLGLKSIHFDVMDGVFVPNISFGHHLVTSICNKLEKDFDTSTHLMVKDAYKQVDNFLQSGTKRIVYHLEDENTIQNFSSVLEKHKKANVGIGISIKPMTNVSNISLDVLKELSEVLVMTVEPGYGGQKLMDKCLLKTRELAELRMKHNLDFIIVIDGGVNGSTINEASKYPIDQFVSGSYIWKNLSEAKKCFETLAKSIIQNKSSIC